MLSIIRRTACEYARNLSREVQVDIGNTEVRMQRHVDCVADHAGDVGNLAVNVARGDHHRLREVVQRFAGRLPELGC